ncbi:quinohemoprotein amine dehydrogenase subunit beta [Noviherbaspirillum sp. CPCC 100848]|uniref:Quinohemoprotein amine dehydrogenase subunit beta n=1 Tax=Noviherbaspirillum album TaxID=3080276 RepID=A0ABU6JGL6_9BURK|nr:quinohemoprotein amine dehydrogenase subunit beta [Noviherbaspirillum sp. CPCC 100848]MEC4722810.1 quinohemoprotein amine dehydrogenase subunit beta [Noviherbaspirillum sp. CPCC 100848]
MNRKSTLLPVAMTIGFAIVTLFVAVDAAAREYLVTAAKPNFVVVVDAAARKVERTIPIPNTTMGNSPTAIAVSKDGKRAYVIHNAWKSVSGLDLQTGEEVFRADLSDANMRAMATYGIDLSPDGKELSVFVVPVRMLPGSYKVEETYIAVFDTAAGKQATPLRKMLAPRGTTVLAYAPDGKTLYSFNGDWTTWDVKSGTQTGKITFLNRERENYGKPDTLALWPQWEQSNIFATPYYQTRTDLKEGDPGYSKAGIMTFDLVTREQSYKDFEDASVVLFSSVVNPIRRNEVYTVYTQLTATDIKTGKIIKRLDLDHTFYNVNVSSDGKEIYIGGTQNDIVVYDSSNFKKLANIKLPTGDQVLSSLRIVDRK